MPIPEREIREGATYAGPGGKHRKVLAFFPPWDFTGRSVVKRLRREHPWLWYQPIPGGDRKPESLSRFARWAERVIDKEPRP